MQPGWFPSLRCSHFSMPDLLQAPGLQPSAHSYPVASLSWVCPVIQIHCFVPILPISSAPLETAITRGLGSSPPCLHHHNSHYCFSVSRDVLLLSKNTNHVLTNAEHAARFLRIHASVGRTTNICSSQHGREKARLQTSPEVEGRRKHCIL